MATITETIELRHRMLLDIDIARANRAGQSVEEFRAARAAQIRKWAEKLHNMMDAAGADDPLQILPEAIAEICAEANAHARETARIVAKQELVRLLKKATL
jgi:hypothetical protein